MDDDPAQRALLRARMLRERMSIIQAASGPEALEQVRLHHPRVVICDYVMPGMDGIELCRQVRADSALDGTYLVIVTSVDCREHKHSALTAGADDYIAKPYDLPELLARVRNGMRIARLQERLQSAARTDGLTGLWNHAQFRTQLDTEFARTRRYGGNFALLMLDLDHFKAVNDTYGHEAGNRVLAATARHLRAMVRDIDMVARYGGEEFAIISPETGPEEARLLAERIRGTLPDNTRLHDLPDLVVTASIGVVADSNSGVNSAIDMINLADHALYAAKRSGRNRIVTADDRDVSSSGPDELQLREVDLLRKQVMSLSLQAKTLCLQSVWALVQALETRDPFTAKHSLKMRFCIERTAAAAGWPASLTETACNAAMLHDLGKIGIPDHLLLKEGPLSEDEAVILRQVPSITCKILSPMRVFETEIVVIRHLRERFDGSGYPDGLAGGRIPLGSRALAVIEAFVAMISGRSYRTHRTLDEALGELKAAASVQFDPALVAALEAASQKERGLWERELTAKQPLLTTGR